MRADKLREVREGHDGTWVAHPALVEVARQVFDEGMPTPNQLNRLRDDVVADAAALLDPPRGSRTEVGLRHNIRVGIQYPRGVAGRPGRRTDLQPDGRRGYRRNLADARSGSGSGIAPRSTTAGR